MNARDNWPRPFWRYYAERYPFTLRTRHFQEGWGNYKAWYQVEGLSIYVKQLLRTGGNVVVYLTGEKMEDKESSCARLAPYQYQIEQFTNNSDLRKAPQTALYAHFLPLRTGTRDPKNWDEATCFMEDLLQKYKQVFGKPFTT